MTIKFNLTATIEIPGADKFPPKEVVEKDIADMLKWEGMVSHELAVTDYRAEGDENENR